MTYRCNECGPTNAQFHFPDETNGYDYRVAGEILTDHAEQQHQGRIDYERVDRKDL